MAEVIRMPSVLAGAAEAAIQTWLVAPGSSIERDQAIAEIETDKAIVEYQAEFAGTVGRLLAAEGDSVAVGDPILVIVEDGDDDAAIEAALSRAGAVSAPMTETPDRPRTAGTIAVDAVAETAAVGAVDDVEAAPAAARRRLFVSPLVRRLAAERGVDIRDVPGTGPNGRIVRRDLERHIASGVAIAAENTQAAAETVAVEQRSPLETGSEAAGFQDIPLDRMRKAIARRLTESKSTVPHFYLVADCRVDDLLTLRAQVNEAADVKVSLNDFVVKAVAAALIEVPEANAVWRQDSIRRFTSADIAVAVATDGGLSTPVVRGVERLPLTEVSRSIADLAGRARTGRLRQHELEGGSFSISNLGMYGVAEFSAILNPPQAGILAVGAARRIPVVDEHGHLVAGSVMTVTLSADHRVIDGAVAAKWLSAFQRRIESPLSILI
jgi:pyruvate dehydrogenase E2 component (dihydrolipoamide acetyltransferase)